MAEPPERRAFVLYVLLLLYVTVMRAAPAARRAMHALARLRADTREPGATVLAGIAWPDRSGGLSQALALCASSLSEQLSERSNLGVIESRMMKPRVEIHAYLGLRRLLLDC